MSATTKAKAKTSVKKPAVAASPQAASAVKQKTVKAKAPKPAATRKGAAKNTKSKAGIAAPKMTAFLSRAAYKVVIDGLRAQGIDHDDAVETLKTGIRQANGLPTREQQEVVATPA